MALFKPFRGARADLPAEKHDGYAYFCTDDGTFHIDYIDENGVLQRKQVCANSTPGGGISIDEVNNLIDVHNVDTEAHNDIRTSMDNVNVRLDVHDDIIDNSIMIDKSFGNGPDTVAEGDHTHGNLELQMQSIEDIINIDYNDKSEAVEFFTDITPSYTLWEASDPSLVTDVEISDGKYVCTSNTVEEGIKTGSMYDMVDLVKGKTIVAVANISSENYTLYVKMYNGTAWSFGRVKKNNKVVSIDVPENLVNFKLGLECNGTGETPETCEMTNFALYIVNDVSITSTAHIPNRNYTIWSWGDEGIKDPEGFAAFCKSYRINRVYQSMYDDWVTYSIKTFVGTMQKNKILVNWLAGEANWILTENQSHITEEIQKVVNYNMSVQNDYEKIGTIQFDIEPYTIDLWDTDRDMAIKLYQDAIVLTYEACIANRLSFNACIPTWFEKQSYDNEYGQGNLFDFVSKHSSSTVLMSYSTTDYVSMSEDEIRIGAENGKNVAVGLETQAVSDRVTEDITFVNHPIEDLYRAFEELYLVYKMYGVTKGIEFVIHYYTSFKEYVEKFNLATESYDILDKLTTTDKTDLISAINEINTEVESLKTPSPMVGATEATDGTTGTVPAPTSADSSKFLRGDGTWADAGSNYPIKNGVTNILPDTYYTFGEVDSLTVNLVNTGDSSKICEYCFEFTPSSNFTGLTITPEPRWAHEIRFIPGMTCQVSVLRGIGVMICA